METKQSRTLWDCLQIITKQWNYVLSLPVNTYIYKKILVLLILTYYFLLLLIIKIHYSQILYILFRIYQYVFITYVSLISSMENNLFLK